MSRSQTDSLRYTMNDVLIIGAGPAGLSAARWCDELGSTRSCSEQNEAVGGQLSFVHNPIDNYLGLHANNGEELRERFIEQTEGSDFDLWTNVEIANVDLKAKRVALKVVRSCNRSRLSSPPVLRRRARHSRRN